MRKGLVASSLLSGVLITLVVSPAISDQRRGTWTNVTPTNVDLRNDLDCDNFGSITMLSDPARPSDLYTQFHCQGVWKSVDYGLTWTGPINVGTGGAGASGAGGMAIARGPSGQPPILYSAGIRGTGLGFWKSTDGGVSWRSYTVAPTGDRQGFYPPVVDPYDPNHLIMCQHQMDRIVRSVDGGRTWTEVRLAPGMQESGGTSFVFFINTGDAATTAQTWLWSAVESGGKTGTWRTADAGATWTRVDHNEHTHGQMQIYQPDTSGVVYMPGKYSALGQGVLRSADFGRTWRHVGSNASHQAIVFGTPKKVYSMFAWACLGCTVDPQMQAAPAPGITGWARMPTPPEMAMGAAQSATVFDGAHYIIVTANWRAGLWRYVEP
jgi:hypothetical protein